MVETLCFRCDVLSAYQQWRSTQLKPVNHVKADKVAIGGQRVAGKGFHLLNLSLGSHAVKRHVLDFVGEAWSKVP
jgi:hypothetical protein